MPRVNARVDRRGEGISALSLGVGVALLQNTMTTSPAEETQIIAALATPAQFVPDSPTLSFTVNYTVPGGVNAQVDAASIGAADVVFTDPNLGARTLTLSSSAASGTGADATFEITNADEFDWRPGSYSIEQVAGGVTGANTKDVLASNLGALTIPAAWTLGSGNIGEGNRFAAASGAKVYYSPTSTTSFIAYNTETQAITSIPTGITSRPFATVYPITASNGKIYATPFDIGDIIEIDPAADSARLIATGEVPLTSPNYGQMWYLGAAEINGVIYFPPGRSENILAYDVAADTVDLIVAGTGGQLITNKWGYPALVGNRIYFAPGRDPNILELDLATNTTRLISLAANGGVTLSSGVNWASVHEANGLAYFIPSTRNDIIEFNPANDNIRAIPTGETGVSRYTNGVSHPNGNIYALPSTGSNNILEYNPNTDAVRLIPAGSVSCSFASLHPNGNIYGAPSGSSATQAIVEYNPASDQVTLTNVASGNFSRLPAIAQNGRLYFPAGDLGAFDPN